MVTKKKVEELKQKIRKLKKELKETKWCECCGKRAVTHVCNEHLHDFVQKD